MTYKHSGESPNGDSTVIIVDTPPSIQAKANPQTQKVRACQRCYKQKLKCDLVRPCPLCVRSGAQCLDRPIKVPSTTRKKRRSNVIETDTKVHSSESNTPPQTVQTISEETVLNGSGQQTPTIFDQCSSHTILSLIQRSKSKASPHSESSWSAISPDTPYDNNQVLPWGHNRPKIRDLLSVLPPRSITHYGLVVYFNTVHWFMFVVHEGQTMKHYRTFMKAIEHDAYTNNLDDTEDFSDVLCLMIQVVMGVKYALAHPVRKRKILNLFMKESGAQDEGRAQELAESSMNTLLSVIRVSLLDSLSSCTLATVQTCVLFGSFYLYHGDPNIAWSILGCGYKCVQTLALNKESYWARSVGVASPDDSELCHLRRRVFWALYIADRFSAISYGLPLEIPDEGCDVGIPDHMAAYAEKGSASFLLMDTDIGAGMDCSLITYQTYKLQFYILLGEVKSSLYSQKEKSCRNLVDCYEDTPRKRYKSHRTKESSSKVQDLILTIKYYDKKLQNWYDALPEVLKMKYHQEWAEAPRDSSELDDDLVDPELYDPQLPMSDEMKKKLIRAKRAIFARQALILQIGYDNIKILINRKLLMYKHQTQVSRNDTEMREDPVEYSRNECWEAAVRSCELSKSRVFAECQETHAGSFVGLHLFTSGVMFYHFGSSEPLGPRSTQAKQGLRTIIQAQRQFTNNFPMAKYGVSILETLIKRMMQKEMELLLTPSNLPFSQPLNVEDYNRTHDARDQETAVFLSSWKSTSGQNSSDMTLSNMEFSSGAQDIDELRMFQEMEFVPNEFFSETISEVEKGMKYEISKKLINLTFSSGGDFES